VTGVAEVPGGRLFFPDERAAELVSHLEAHWSPASAGPEAAPNGAKDNAARAA